MKTVKLSKKILLVILLMPVMILSACGNNKSNTNVSESSRTKIGIIAAMDCEIDILKEAVGNPVIENIAGCDYYSGTIGNYDVVLVKCGIGKVSAAAGT